ncbi:MAG: hypothetical protein ACYDC6_14105 [Acidobacteriaceae bacterium]
MVRDASRPITDESPGVLYQDLFEKTLEAQLADLEKKLRELPKYKTMDRRLTQLLIEKLKDKIRVQDEAEAAREELDFKLERATKDLAETPESRPALRELRLLMVQRLENEIRVQDGVEPEPIQPSEGIARRALQEAKEARAGLLAPTDPPPRESEPIRLKRPPISIESSDGKGQLIHPVQTRSYRWGKFQGWTTFVIGLVTFLPTPFMGAGISVQLIEYTAGAVLIFLGLGLAHKRRFGLVLLYSHLPLFLLGFAFLDIPRFEIVFAVCWYFIPAAFYYPKRWKEFSRDLQGGVSSAKPNTNRLKSIQTTLLNKLKDAGWVVLGMVVLLAIVAVAGVFLGAAEALSEYVLPWCIRVAFWGLLALIVVLLPASLVRRWRSFTSPAMLVLSYLFGATVWMDGLVLTMTIWGGWAVVIGLFIMGIGIVPIAMLATLFHGMWFRFTELVFLLALTFGSRFLAIWIGGTLDAEE